MNTPRRFALALGALAVLAACSDQPTGAGPAAPAPQQSLDAVFDRAGRDFGVPASLLKSVGYVETRWQMVEGHTEFEGMPAAHGLMALRGERLREGARRVRT